MLVSGINGESGEVNELYFITGILSGMRQINRLKGGRRRDGIKRGHVVVDDEEL